MRAGLSEWLVHEFHGQATPLCRLQELGQSVAIAELAQNCCPASVATAASIGSAEPPLVSLLHRSTFGRAARGDAHPESRSSVELVRLDEVDEEEAVQQAAVQHHQVAFEQCHRRGRLAAGELLQVWRAASWGVTGRFPMWPVSGSGSRGDR